MSRFWGPGGPIWQEKFFKIKNSKNEKFENRKIVQKKHFSFRDFNRAKA
jgi:hypothetical protein